MKRLILGDIHGHWKTAYDIYNKENPDIVIFLGDYVDGYACRSVDDVKECLESLLELRENHIREHGKDSCIMLIGNHDYHYVEPGEQYSGYSHAIQRHCGSILQKMFDDNIVQYVYVDRINKSIYSHAGISQTWYDEYVDGNCELEEINEKVQSNAYWFTFRNGDWHGDSIYSSPIWIRPFSLGKDQLKIDNEEWRQVVGHTTTIGEGIVDFNKEKFANFKEHCNLILCDCLPRQYMVETLNDKGIITKVEYKDNIIE
ncbi:MAG: metallophosphoesterase [Clostridia bacterium]|nr:metallophosphoesterase [Clostridia bacterium]